MHIPFIEEFSIESLLVLVYVIDILIAVTVVFLEHKNPSATLAWIMILFLLPGVGIVLYFLLSQNIAKKKLFRLTQREKEIVEELLYNQTELVKRDQFRYLKADTAAWKDLILLNQNYSKALLTQNNSITMLTDGNHMFESLIADIEAAKTYINLEFFIVKNDVAGQRLLNVLTKKAREGVTVRFLMDAMGSRFMTHKVMAPFKEAGGRYAFFFPPRFRGINLKFNYRNHRKIVIIDDKIGYLGGYNIAREYLDKKRKFGHWRDTHLRVEGNSIRNISARFVQDWRFASHEQISIEAAYAAEVPAPGDTAVQIVSSGPDSLRQEIKHAYLRMITGAQKNIYIQSPYFVPDNTIFDALQNAALSGVDVRIMIPCMPDHMFVYWATYYYCGLLLRSGVKVYIYDNGFLHAKTIAVDGAVCSVGSANFDIRSYRLNFETNAFIFDEDETYKLEAIFEEDMAESHELTRSLYAQRSLWIKFKEGIAKLLSDLL